MFGKKRFPPAAFVVAAEGVDPALFAAERESAIDVTDAAGDAVSDAELAAVIAAAVAAYGDGGDAACELVYRKIDRAAGPRTAWNLAGLREVLASRGI
jgi:hypothetical protein